MVVARSSALSGPVIDCGNSTARAIWRFGSPNEYASSVTWRALRFVAFGTQICLLDDASCQVVQHVGIEMHSDVSTNIKPALMSPQSKTINRIDIDLHDTELGEVGRMQSHRF
jgi:hypothetical protein